MKEISTSGFSMYFMLNVESDWSVVYNTVKEWKNTSRGCLTKKHRRPHLH